MDHLDRLTASWLEDTDPKTRQVLIELNSKLTPADRIAQVFALNEMNRAIQEAVIRKENPDADDREVLRLLALRRFDPETVERMFGPGPS